LKKIVFLIIASLLVIGLVLPGCEGETTEGPVTYTFEDDTINICIAGPMGYLQGDDMMRGAEMAVDELGTVSIAGESLTINLMETDTHEINPSFPDQPKNQVENAIANGADFVIGGFRTEGTAKEVEAAMDADTMMFICGSATAAILEQVNDNYDKYKYLFRAQPLNEVFLFINCIMMMANVGFGLVNGPLGAGGYGVFNTTQDIRVAFLAEDLIWTESPRESVEEAIDGLNFTYAGTVECSDTATSLTTEMGQLAAMNPTIIFSFLSGPVGITYGKAQADSAEQVAALTVGINVESQDPNYWTQCTGDAGNNGAEGQITLMTWAPGIEQTAKTADFLDDWEAAYPAHPIPTYTAATYDIIKALVLALQDEAAVNTETGDVEVLAEDLIDWYEDPANEQVTTSGKAGFYVKDATNDYLISLGVPCYAHDLKYGPQQLATGLGVEWESTNPIGGGYYMGGNGTVRAVWPDAALDEVNESVCPFNAALGLNWTDFTFTGISTFGVPYWILADWTS